MRSSSQEHSNHTKLRQHAYTIIYYLSQDLLKQPSNSMHTYIHTCRRYTILHYLRFTTSAFCSGPTGGCVWTLFALRTKSSRTSHRHVITILTAARCCARLRCAFGPDYILCMGPSSVCLRMICNELEDSSADNSCCASWHGPAQSWAARSVFLLVSRQEK